MKVLLLAPYEAKSHCLAKFVRGEKVLTLSKASSVATFCRQPSGPPVRRSFHKLVDI